MRPAPTFNRLYRRRLEASYLGGLASIFIGAALAAGPMLYRIFEDGVTYTAESWIGIPAIWAVLWNLLQ